MVRGSRLESPYAPSSGYRYDGLYRVEDAWSETGKSGFKVWRYRLVGGAPPASKARTPPTAPPSRTRTSVLRVVRDTALGRQIKKLHKYQCQVCGVRLEGPSGPYAEAAHIQPLGRPHNGPDVSENILCLCSNHHVLFDLGAFSIADTLDLLGIKGRLRTHPRHAIGRTYVQYPRSRYGF